MVAEQLGHEVFQVPGKVLRSYQSVTGSFAGLMNRDSISTGM